LQAFLDGEIREPRSGELERHLIVCEVCSKRFSALAVSLAVTEHALDALERPSRGLDIERSQVSTSLSSAPSRRSRRSR